MQLQVRQCTAVKGGASCNLLKLPPVCHLYACVCELSMCVGCSAVCAARPAEVAGVYHV
jgi:hypothetical protein